jgi:hypothetical protein
MTQRKEKLMKRRTSDGDDQGDDDCYDDDCDLALRKFLPTCNLIHP